jgi:hypothetical protein
VQCRPGLIADIPWSTRAAVFGMTRTTEDPSGRDDSRRSVVIPAAIEMTVLPETTWSRISSSSPVMSCGLTTRTSVSASAAASALPSTSTP